MVIAAVRRTMQAMQGLLVPVGLIVSECLVCSTLCIMFSASSNPFALPLPVRVLVLLSITWHSYLG